ncbi:MAG: S-adenosyl-l-methionine hydroxide adenosyltransferase family protein [Nitrososphaeria archaeon]|nr:S-adenosyl-l-methionine hydroxide adenosyltransferase family protein [Nitrososphaeria archaeon]
MGRPIVFLTDFGEGSIFVGEMKGVILKINPNAKILELTNSIRPQNVFQAAFLLKYSYKYFPKNTIFLCIVDPEVGSERKPIVVKSSNYYFIGPDNGLLYPAAFSDGIKFVVLIENKKYFLEKVSYTFHGRDIFAPVAAYISKGVPLKNFGPTVSSIRDLVFEEPTFDENGCLVCRVMYIDSFGNVVTNLEEPKFYSLLFKYNLTKTSNLYIFVGQKLYEVKMVKYYCEVGEGSPLALFNSFGLLELSINKGNASEYFSLKEGDVVKIRFFK